MAPINALLDTFITRLHEQFEGSLQDLSDAQLHWRPNDETLQIAFHAWHFLRTKDNVVNFVLQDRKMPLWVRENMHETWKLPKVAQGTGMSREDALALRVPSAQALIDYGRVVHDDVMPYLRGVGVEELHSLCRLDPWGERSKLEHILQTLIAHGNGHLGQIDVLRCLQGLRPAADI